MSKSLNSQKGVGPAPIYITLYQFNFKGTVKDFPNAFEAVKAEEEAASVKFINFYLTMGQYDAAGIVEAPDDKTMATLLLAAGERGNVRTETLRAFPEDEYREIVAALP